MSLNFLNPFHCFPVQENHAVSSTSIDIDIAVAWLANTFGQLGMSHKAGEVILSSALDLLVAGKGR